MELVANSRNASEAIGESEVHLLGRKSRSQVAAIEISGCSVAGNLRNWKLSDYQIQADPALRSTWTKGAEIAYN